MGEPGDAGDIRTRAHTGTLNFAAHLAIPAALDFHEAIGGSAAKGARLRYLRNLWVAEARKIDGVDILTPDDPRMICALTGFRYKNRTTTAENNAIVEAMLKSHRVFTARRTAPAAGDCVRVTPSIYNSPEDVMHVVAAINALG